MTKKPKPSLRSKMMKKNNNLSDLYSNLIYNKLTFIFSFIFQIESSQI